MIKKNGVIFFTIWGFVISSLVVLFALFAFVVVLFCGEDVTFSSVIPLGIFLSLFVLFGIFLINRSALKTIYKIEFNSEEIICYALLKKYVIKDKVIFFNYRDKYILKCNNKRFILMKLGILMNKLFTDNDINEIKRIYKNIV